MADWKSNLRSQLQVDDPTTPANSMEELAKKYTEWRLQQFPFNEQSDDYLAGGGPFSAGRLSPLQATRAIRGWANANFSGIPTQPNLANEEAKRYIGPIFQYRRWLKDNWKDVGGAGPTDAKVINRGSEAIALKASPVSGDTGEVMKFMPYVGRKDPVRDAIGDKGLLSEEFMVPTRAQVHPVGSVGYAVQPEVTMARDAQKELPRTDFISAISSMLTKIKQSPYSFIDAHPGNVGFMGNKARVLDLGALERRGVPDANGPVTMHDVNDLMRWR